MPTVTDGRGETIHLLRPPQRVVSLVPSTTETLFALGLGERVVGVTRFCVHPTEALASRVRVGGTKDIDMERLHALKPDLVIGNAEENTRQMFTSIEEHYPLYVAFPQTVDDALDDLTTMGALLSVEEEAHRHRTQIEVARTQLRATQQTPFRYAYLIWRKPWMALNGETFIAAMLREAGGINIFEDIPERYFELTAQQLAEAAPDRVLLSSEPFPFKDKHRTELAEQSGLSVSQLALIDGEYCSWHGVRMAAAFGYLAAWRSNNVAQT